MSYKQLFQLIESVICPRTRQFLHHYEIINNKLFHNSHFCIMIHNVEIYFLTNEVTLVWKVDREFIMK